MLPICTYEPVNVRLDDHAVERRRDDGIGEALAGQREFGHPHADGGDFFADAVEGGGVLGFGNLLGREDSFGIGFGDGVLLPEAPPSVCFWFLLRPRRPWLRGPEGPSPV